MVEQSRKTVLYVQIKGCRAVGIQPRYRRIIYESDFESRRKALPRCRPSVRQDPRHGLSGYACRKLYAERLRERSKGFRLSISGSTDQEDPVNLVAGGIPVRVAIGDMGKHILDACGKVAPRDGE